MPLCLSAVLSSVGSQLLRSTSLTTGRNCARGRNASPSCRTSPPSLETIPLSAPPLSSPTTMPVYGTMVRLLLILYKQGFYRSRTQQIIQGVCFECLTTVWIAGEICESTLFLPLLSYSFFVPSTLNCLVMSRDF